MALLSASSMWRVVLFALAVAAALAQSDERNWDGCALETYCQMHSGDGICDPSCNSRECYFDGFDCMLPSVHWSWADCPQAAMCVYRWGDGVCNSECNTRGCLWDGLDCASSGTLSGTLRWDACGTPDECRAKSGDGICDVECDKTACNWDGLDCFRNGAPPVSSYSSCALSDFCRFRFADGACDAECNSAQCMYDGWDCVGASTPSDTTKAPSTLDACLYRDLCALMANNSQCDQICNTRECNFDSGECSSSSDTGLCLSHCSQLAGNGICNRECNSDVCNYDAGDCVGASASGASDDLWAHCPTAVYCKSAMNNGVCDDQCMRYECMWDFEDCRTVLSTRFFNDPSKWSLCSHSECSNLYADSHCDAKCDSFVCNWDGFDCDPQGFTSLVERTWDNCTNADHCRAVFADGVCDRDCNHLACNWDGLDCEKWKLTLAAEPNWSDCPVPACKQLYGNKVCDSMCNTAACNWDGLDCMESMAEKAWSSCPNRTACESMMADGICSPNEVSSCGSAECMFSSAIDCGTGGRRDSGTQACPSDMACEVRFKDGICDQLCKSRECGFDGGDCDTPMDHIGDIDLVVEMMPTMFVDKRRSFQRNLGILLNGIATIKAAQAFILPDPSPSDDVSPDRFKTQVRLSFDAAPDSPFRRPVDIALFLAVMNQARVLSSEVGFGLTPVTLANTVPPTPTPLPNSSGVNVVGIVVGCVLGVCGVAVVAGGAAYGVKQMRKNEDRKRRRDSEAGGSAAGGAGTHEMGEVERPAKAIKLEYGPPAIPDVQTTDVVIFHTDEAEPDDVMLSPLHLVVLKGDVQAVAVSISATRIVDSSRVQCNYPVRGATASSLDREDGRGNTPLHLAAEKGTTKIAALLLTEGANPSAQNHLGESPLHIACANGHAELVATLAARGADLLAVNRNGRTALHECAARGSVACVDVLVRAARSRPSAHLPPSSTDVCTELLDAADSDGETALMCAIKANQTDLASRLIEYGANVLCVTKKGWNALHWACAVNCLPLVVQLLEKDKKVDINSTNAKGETPLHLAAREGNADVVRLLLSRFANRNLEDNQEKNPAQIAAAHGHQEVIALLNDWTLATNASRGSNKLRSVCADPQPGGRPSQSPPSDRSPGDVVVPQMPAHAGGSGRPSLSPSLPASDFSLRDSLSPPVSYATHHSSYFSESPSSDLFLHDVLSGPRKSFDALTPPSHVDSLSPHSHSSMVASPPGPTDADMFLWVLDDTMGGLTSEI